MITVYPIGTTIYYPDKCSSGYTIFSYEVGILAAIVMNMNGEIINKIFPVRAARAKLLSNGHIMTVSGMAWSTWSQEGDIREYDWQGRIVWKYKPPGLAHHDFQRLPNGNTLLVYQEEMPKEYRSRIKDVKRGNIILSDCIVEITYSKKVVWEWHAFEHLDLNWYNPACGNDWLHINTVRILPENRHYDAGDDRFRPGNIIVSPRSLDAILIVDKESKNVVWKYHGKYNGGLQGQHDPQMIEKGLPGAGNIIVFDNGSSTFSMASIRHAGESYILEINPVTKEIVWKYDDGERFFSKFRGSVQRLPNGNTLICEADGRRIFEVTLEYETVWEYAVPYSYRIGRAIRVPYNFCTLTRSLGSPQENCVLPIENIGRN